MFKIIICTLTLFATASYSAQDNTPADISENPSISTSIVQQHSSLRGKSSLEVDTSNEIATDVEPTIITDSPLQSGCDNSPLIVDTSNEIATDVEPTIITDSSLMSGCDNSPLIVDTTNSTAPDSSLRSRRGQLALKIVTSNTTAPDPSLQYRCDNSPSFDVEPTKPIVITNSPVRPVQRQRKPLNIGKLTKRPVDNSENVSIIIDTQCGTKSPASDTPSSVETPENFGPTNTPESCKSITKTENQ